MPLAVVLILLVVGSILFHLLSPWTFTPLASNWGMVDFTVEVTLWVTGAVFVAVNLFMAVCVIKFRHKKDSRSKYEPENKKLETWLTVITTIGVAAMLTPGLLVWAKFVDVPEANPGAKSFLAALSLSPVFETARMYTGPEPAIDLPKLFGVTTFELG